MTDVLVAEIDPCSILPREMRLNQSEFLYQGRKCEVLDHALSMEFDYKSPFHITFTAGGTFVRYSAWC